MKPIYISTMIILGIYSTVNSAFCQDLKKNERYEKAIRQVVSSFAIHRALTEDKQCASKRYQAFSVDEAVAAIPETELKDNERKAFRNQLATMSPLLEAKMQDGKPMYLSVYDQGIAAARASSQISNEQGSQCDFMYQAAKNIFQNAKNNFRLIGQ